MDEIDFDIIDHQIELIEALELGIIGNTILKSKEVEAAIEKKNGVSYFRLNIGEETEFEEVEFHLKNQDYNLLVSGHITGRRNFIDNTKNIGYRYSEGIISSYKDLDWIEQGEFYFTGYYFNSDSHLLHSQFGTKNIVHVKILNKSISLIKDDDFLIVKSNDKLDFNLFSKITYNTLVALGFISGHFIQDNVYIFQSDNIENFSKVFKYRKLRASFKSIYHCMVWNPYGYKHFVGAEYANKLYKDETLLVFDEQSFSRLIELCLNKSQIQYAIVLFNEANGNDLSLLVKNNCFYAVLEVLKKFLYQQNKELLPNDYSQKGNIERFKLIFNTVTQIDEDEVKTLEKRNVFLHGDIEGMEDKEMADLMLKQITLIYKILISYIGYKGFIIDHFHIRNGNKENAFIKIN
jgi:hypothetical protein